MNESSEPVETDVPLFDVFVELPAGRGPSAINQTALLESGLSPEQTSNLIAALQKSHSVKVGAAVTRERGDAARTKFANSGLTVSVTPVLTILAVKDGAGDGRFLCPACEKKVLLSDSRQCPECGVFVDKVDADFLLRRKIMQQERAKLDFQSAKETKDAETRTRRALEAALRAKIREELEAEYGIEKVRPSIFAGKAGLLRGAGLVVLLAASFVAGQSVPSADYPWRKERGAIAAKGQAADVDKMLSAGLGASVASPETGAAPGTGDPDIDNDPMMKAIGGHRIGAKGISIEQALGAATVLAKSVGHTTAERSVAGGNPVAERTKAGPATATDEPPAGPAAVVPTTVKLSLKAGFAVALAELDQWQRALGVIKAIKADPAYAKEAQAVQVTQRAELAVQAWAMQRQPADKARAAADALRAQAQAIPDAAQRSRVLTEIGVIMGQQARLAPEVSHAFLTLAAGALKAVTDPAQQQLLVGEWMVAMARVLGAEVTAQARNGRLDRAQHNVAAMEDLLAQTADPATQIGLRAQAYAARQALGQADLAERHLTEALRLSTGLPSLALRASSLRTLGASAGSGASASVLAALTTLAAQLDPAVGQDKAMALTQLALLQADRGDQVQSDRFTQRAESAKGLSEAELFDIKSLLLVQRSLASASALHRAQAFAQSEAVLQRVGNYLF